MYYNERDFLDVYYDYDYAYLNGHTRRLERSATKTNTASTNVSISISIMPMSLETKTIDELLDIYNDYTTLYHIFKDEAYKDHAELIKHVLKLKTTTIKE